MELKDWQRPIKDKVLEALRTHNVCALASGTGSGKTYISAQAIKDLGLTPLVLCPKAAKSVWASVLEGFGITPLAIVNWERVIANKFPYYQNKVWSLPEGTVVVADEAHKGCSGPDTQTGEALARIKTTGRPALLVSATLASNALQLRHTGFLLGLHRWNKGSFYEWARAQGCWWDRDYGYWRKPKGRRAQEIMAGIRQELNGKMVYLPVSEIPGFPESEVIAKLIDLNKEYADAINKAWADMSDALKQPGASELAERTKARQRTEILKVPALVDMTLDALEQGFSVVTFFNFTEPMTLYKTSLRMEHDIDNISSVFGGQDTGVGTAKRDKEVQLFQENINHVACVMVKAGGVSLSLHDLKHERPRLTLVNPGDDPCDVQQALGRTPRVGGTKCVQIFPMAAGTVEEKVYHSLQSKLGALHTLNTGDLTPV